jgi:pimeloyl-ACP methyl ester carboxylesterase
MAEEQPLSFESPRIARLYEGVPPEQVQRLHRFRAEHPCQQARIAGVDWEYIEAGQGNTALLLLTGALATAESSWMTISHLASLDCGRRFRVIAPSYPGSIGTAAELVDGIAGVLDTADVDMAHVMGGSYGGYVAQIFVRRHPDRVDRLIVSLAGPPDAERGKQIARAMRWLRLLPAGLLRALVSRSLGRLLPEGLPEASFYRAYMREVFSTTLTKEVLLNSYRRAMDMDLNYTFTPGDLADWPGHVLLILAEEDPVTPAPVREAMMALYPGAQVYLFPGLGHEAPAVRQEEYYAVIEAFLGGFVAPNAPDP